MGRSRYAGNDIIADSYYATWDGLPQDPYAPDILDGVETIDHIIQAGERLDIIAHRYYGDEEYWWVIALANHIVDPFSLEIGRRLQVPTSAKSILDKLPH